jgi:hypothetical protein
MQHVNLDVLREDAKRYVDRTGRACGVEQGPENGLADLSSAFFGQRGLSQAMPDEVADIRNR